WIAAGFLIAPRGQRVERQRIRVRDGALLFHEDAEHARVEQRKGGERRSQSVSVRPNGGTTIRHGRSFPRCAVPVILRGERSAFYPAAAVNRARRGPLERFDGTTNRR